MLIVYKGVVYVMTAVTEAFNGAKIQISLKDNVQNTARPSKKAGAIVSLINMVRPKMTRTLY